MKEYGKLIGRYFYAWTIVLDSQVHFEPLFKDYIKTYGLLNPNSNKGNISLKLNKEEIIELQINKSMKDVGENILFEHTNIGLIADSNDTVNIPPLLTKSVKEKRNNVIKKDIKIDLSKILTKIKFDKNEITRKKVEQTLIELDKIGLISESDGMDFATIAWILYKTGWVININTFTAWLKLLSEVCNREKVPTYKPNKLERNIEKMKGKSHLLNFF